MIKILQASLFTLILLTGIGQADAQTMPTNPTAVLCGDPTTANDSSCFQTIFSSCSQSAGSGLQGVAQATGCYSLATQNYCLAKYGLAQGSACANSANAALQGFSAASGGTGTPPPGASGGISSGLLNITWNNPLSVNTLDELIIAILNILTIIAIPIITLFIIYAGFLYVTARGNAEQVRTATTALTFAIIGAILIIGAVAVTTIMQSTITQFTGP